jgi:hypothetical protein
MSRCHGDLNRNNIHYRTDKDEPFFIDFALFQDPGHTLQDLAQVEAEVKFALMDREEDSGLKGLDYTPEQLPVWWEAEEPFASGTWRGLPAGCGCKGNKKGVDKRGVDRAYRLVASIRDRARLLHDAVPPGPDGKLPFRFEYSVPLLYHTLRAIGYKGEERSPFKRMLAALSADRLIKCLDAYPLALPADARTGSR